MRLDGDILRTLLYYDIWEYPLTAEELFVFLPRNSITLGEFKQYLRNAGPGGDVHESGGFFFVGGRDPRVVARRRVNAKHARLLWKPARIAMHIIKRFPFVKAVFVSGDLSKNATMKGSDVDFFIITAPGRLWIARWLLILFKKLFLFNRKKYFCLNYFVSEDALDVQERNLYIATEIAHLKPLYNSDLFQKYIQANEWIKEYFPNYDTHLLTFPSVSERRSVVQQVFELPFMLLPAGALDAYLMKNMERIWARRYPGFDEETRTRLFRCTRTESRAHPLNYQDKVLTLYSRKLQAAGLAPAGRVSHASPQ